MMDIDLQLDSTQMKEMAGRLTGQYLKAGTQAVADSTKWLERELEAVTRSAVPGKLWRAWASASYPLAGGPARNPAGEVFLNGRTRTSGAMAFWTEPGQIKGKRGQWLAIPTAAAGSRGRSRDLTPGEWERAHGQRLKFVYRGGRRSALLIAEGTTNGRTGGYRPITRQRTARDIRAGFQRGVQSIVIFVLVPMVKHANSVAIEPVIQRARGRLEKDFVARVGRIG